MSDSSPADGHESLLALVALGYGTGIVPRLVLESSATASRVVEVPATPALESLTIGLSVRRTDLRRPVVAALRGLTSTTQDRLNFPQ